MSLFTLLFDYDGGSYITQSSSSSIENAATNCLRDWNIKDTRHKITKIEKESLISQLSKAELFKMENLINTWGVGGLQFRGTQIVLKLVKTDEDI